MYFVAFSTDHTTRLVGLTSFSAYQSVNGTTTMTAMSTASWTGGEIIANSSGTGIYRIKLNDSTINTIPAGIDDREVVTHITNSSGMDPVTRTYEIYRRSVTTGQTLTVNSSGQVVALLSSGTGTGQIVLSSGVHDVNVIQYNGQSQTSRDLGADSASILSKVTSVETNTTGLVVRLSSVNTNLDSVLTKLTSVETDVDGVVTKLTSVETDVDTVLTRVTSIDTKVTAIQAQTTQFAFTQSGVVDANIQYVNDVAVQGTGTTTDTWRPV
jgi:hypothetical protein